MKTFIYEIWKGLLSGAVLVIVVGVYQDTNGFRTAISFWNFVGLFCAVSIAAYGLESLIAAGVAKGIAQAKAVEAKQLLSFNEGFKEFRDAKLAASQEQK